MKELSISPSFHINHIYYYGQALRDDIIGKDRAEITLPIKSCLNHDIPFSLHADQPMYESDPLSLLETAVTRQTRGGDTIGVAEKISVEEGLKALTIYAAYQINMEDKIGSIEEGKYADLVILDKNPLKVAETEIREINVQATYTNGYKIY